ncbi:hypothetical protein [Pseudoalteromonas luteoviolacea]|uniref:Uncharacterized protein n=1 Tax=Pseudoalteromonas luteoviolacea NCIMB 1942 TaxID=1365253 RepID=A0A167B033_9GAMM|nr:hypothetical protein [Pseudoalteromonas luteoviolacea]KZN46005.1 hypothetical protein N482_13085 [Pseudoalteromonas luteoviolacea NCIMB 1942]
MSAMIAEGAPQQTAWGNIVGGTNQALTSALNIWQQVETVKAARNSTGQGQAEHAATTELDNGAAVLVEAPKPTPAEVAQQQAKAEEKLLGLPKNTVLAGGGVLLVILLIKAVK